MEENLYAALIADATLAALVPAARICPLFVRQGDPLPAATYMVTGKQPINHANGTSSEYEATLEIECFAESYAGVKALARAVRGVLSGYSEGSASTTGQITMLHLSDESDDAMIDLSGEDRAIFVVTQNYHVEFLDV